MSAKPARGTKRVCNACGSKFYDLNRDPAACPICGANYSAKEPSVRALAGGNALDDEEDDGIAPDAPVELVSLDAAEAAEDEVPDVDDGELPEVDEDEENLKDGEEFLPEDDADADVSDLIGEGEDDDEVR